MQQPRNRASHFDISPRTVKRHLRTLFVRAGIKEGRKREKLVTAMFITRSFLRHDPVPNYSRQQATESTIRPRWRILIAGGVPNAITGK